MPEHEGVCAVVYNPDLGKFLVLKRAEDGGFFIPVNGSFLEADLKMRILKNVFSENWKRRQVLKAKYLKRQMPSNGAQIMVL